MKSGGGKNAYDFGLKWRPLTGCVAVSGTAGGRGGGREESSPAGRLWSALSADGQHQEGGQGDIVLHGTMNFYIFELAFNDMEKFFSYVFCA